MKQVGRLLRQADEGLGSNDGAARVAALRSLRDVELKRRLRGNARAEAAQAIRVHGEKLILSSED